MPLVWKQSLLSFRTLLQTASPVMSGNRGVGECTSPAQMRVHAQRPSLSGRNTGCEKCLWKRLAAVVMESLERARSTHSRL